MSVMQSRFPGRCAGCGQSFPKGETIDYRRAAGTKGRAYHYPACKPTDTEDDKMGAQKARPLRLHSTNPEYVVVTTETGGEVDAYVPTLPRAEVLKAAKLAFPQISGREWWTVDTDVTARAIMARDANVAFPNGLPEPTAAKPAAKVAAKPAAGDDATQLAALIAKLAGSSVDEEKVRAIVDDAILSVIDTIPARKVTISLPDRDADLPETHHEALPEVIQVIAAGCHVFMVGPAGSGKSTIAHQAADALGRPFYALSLGPTTPTSKLFGYMDASGNYVRTPFRDAYEYGGVMLLDELDNGHPGLVAEINQALANGYCAFADGMVKRHDSFVMIATGNTFGRGPDRQYVGRNILDAATLDRFATIDIGYDVRMERGLAMAFATDETDAPIREWIARVLMVRGRVEALKLPVVVSPRASIDGARLIASGMSPERVAEIRLWAGVPADTRSKLDIG